MRGGIHSLVDGGGREQSLSGCHAAPHHPLQLAKGLTVRDRSSRFNGSGWLLRLRLRVSGRWLELSVSPGLRFGREPGRFLVAAAIGR